MPFFNLFRNIGLAKLALKQTGRNVRAARLARSLALLVALLSIIVAIALVSIFGWVLSAKLALLNAVLYFIFFFINQAGHTYISSLLQSSLLPLFALMVSVLVKANELYTEEPEYFDSRLIIVISTIVPLVLINVRGAYYKLVFALLPSFLCLLLYDAIHNYFGVGYYQTGHSAANYTFARVIFPIMYLLMVASFSYYKLLLERTEYNLLRKHQEVDNLYKEVQSQNEELYSQADQLNAQANALSKSQYKLKEANVIISNQKKLLEEENANLLQNVFEKNKMLEDSNLELQKRLEELRQFSYTISHNLRGPVASILGLFNLFDAEKAFPANARLIKLANKSANVLDQVILDLSQVLHLREGSLASESVNIQQEVNSVLLTLRQILEKGQIHTNVELKVKEITSVRPYIHSILYNLISNAAKYRQEKGKPTIWVKSYVEGDKVVLEVTDNGIGINLQRDGDSLFKMYKRFNIESGGRGLGLYLIKIQTEALGGTIRLSSKLGQGSKFTVHLPAYNQQPTKINF